MTTWCPDCEHHARIVENTRFCRILGPPASDLGRPRRWWERGRTDNEATNCCLQNERYPECPSLIKIVFMTWSCYLACVSSFEREMSAAVKDVQRSVFLDLIRSHPEMTLAELSKLSKGQFSGLLSSVTVGEVINAGQEFGDAEPMQAASSGSSTLTGSSAGSSGSMLSSGAMGSLSLLVHDESADEVNTRTAAGRREYDQRVLEFVRESDEAVSATEVRNHIGGTSLQVRKSVARLIEDEKVTWQGKARGTRYSAL